MTNLMDQLRLAVLPEAEIDDAELLGRFIEQRDEAAIAALVRRHGPMVWGVCRRLLPHHDAEDAFQAAFIILVRKAASVKPRGRLANWLHGVARHAALQARRAALRRRMHEVHTDPMPEAVAAPLDTDLRDVLDEELSRLPEIYRAVLVLCELEARSRRDVARQLGVPEGTVAGRLARAKELLVKRLSRRGLALSAGFAFTGPVSASPSLVDSTVKAASPLAAGRAAGVSPNVAALTEEVMKTLFVPRIKAMAAVVLLAGLAIAAVNIVSVRPAAADVPVKAGAAAPEAKSASEKEPALRIVCFPFGDDDKTPSAFVETSTGEWKEYYKGEVFAVWKDISSTGEFVHLVDESRGNYVRLYKEQAYLSSTRKDRGELLYRIGWAKGSLKGSPK